MKEEKISIRYFGIKWNSKTDGKGIRTVIYLQGCNQSCPWCHSPHSQPQISPILLNPDYCSRCRYCVNVCNQNVHFIQENKHYTNSEACLSCGNCIEHCNNSQNQNSSLNALYLPTKETTPYELFQKVQPQLSLLKDIGGVTISGGEPMLQYKALKQFLSYCNKHQIHTSIETSGGVPFYYFKSIHKLVKHWLFGIRPVAKEYSKYVANINTVINNISRLSRLTKNITVRVPLIKNILDKPIQIKKIISVMHQNNLSHIELLPFNPYTDHYYKAMGNNFSLQGNCSPDNKNVDTITDLLESENIKTKIIQIK